MNLPVMTKTYELGPICQKEALRYAGCKDIDVDQETLDLYEKTAQLMEQGKRFKACYIKTPLEVQGNICNFGYFELESKTLAKNLKGCQEALILAATAGIEIDRLIAKYTRIAPSKALMLQAIGTERVEALCDAFIDDMERSQGWKTRPRFSPGYGDLPLESQRKLFSVLNPQKHIGLTLNDSLLMSPSKSVTAIAGIEQETSRETRKETNKCAVCTKQDCEYRGAI